MNSEAIMTSNDTIANPPAAQTIAPWVERLAIALTVLVAICDSVRWFLPYLLRQDLYHFDACQHVWWTYKFADPELFKGDYIMEFFSAPVFTPPGWRWLFRAAAPFVDVQIFSDFLPFVLSAVTWPLAYVLGKRVSGGSVIGGVVAIAFAVTTEFMYHLVGGFGRSFGLPLLMLGVWSTMTRRQVWLGVSALLCALFYPPIALMLGLYAGIVLGVRVWRERRLPPRWPILVGLGIVGVGLIGYSYLVPLPREMGPKTTGAEAREMPEFGQRGRSVFFGYDWDDFWFNKSRSGIGLTQRKSLIFSIMMIAGLIFLRRAVPWEAFVLLFVVLFWWGLAHATLFTLYLPNRYARFGLPLFGMLWFAAIVPRLVEISLQSAALRTACLKMIHPRPIFVAAIVFAIAVIGITTWQTERQMTMPAPDWNAPAAAEAAFAFLHDKLPKNALVAAHPFDADQIPLRAQRSVLANRETALPYYHGFYDQVKVRLEDELAACYTDDWADVEALHDKYGVDVFVVNLNRYGNPQDIFYHRPFNRENWDRYEKNSPNGFILLNPPADRILFKQGDVMIVRLGP